MADSLKVEMIQTDEATGKAISRATVEWYGMDRHEANGLSLGLVGAIGGAIAEADQAKYEGEVAKQPARR